MTSALDADALYRHCDPQVFDFETTAELRGREHMVGQQRALSTLHFDTSIRQPDYNVFVLGSRGAGDGKRLLTASLAREGGTGPALLETIPVPIVFVP